MIVAHGNSLRGIVKHIDGLTAEEIQSVGIPNGIPLVYKFDKDMRPVEQPLAVAPLSGEFLEKKGLLRAALDREAEFAANIPGYEVRKNISSVEMLYTQSPPMDPYLRTLTILNQVCSVKAALSYFAATSDHVGGNCEWSQFKLLLSCPFPYITPLKKPIELPRCPTRRLHSQCIQALYCRLILTNMHFGLITAGEALVESGQEQHSRSRRVDR